jgi:hypothetical protein
MEDLLLAKNLQIGLKNMARPGHILHGAHLLSIMKYGKHGKVLDYQGEAQ